MTSHVLQSHSTHSHREQNHSYSQWNNIWNISLVSIPENCINNSLWEVEAVALRVEVTLHCWCSPKRLPWGASGIKLIQIQGGIRKSLLQDGDDLFIYSVVICAPTYPLEMSDADRTRASDGTRSIVVNSLDGNLSLGLAWLNLELVAKNRNSLWSWGIKWASALLHEGFLSLHSAIAAREEVQSAGISKKSSASSEDINSLHYLLTKKFIISKSVRVQDKTDQRENQPSTLSVTLCILKPWWKCTMWTDRIRFIYPQSLLLYLDPRKDAIVSLAKKREIF